MGYTVDPLPPIFLACTSSRILAAVSIESASTEEKSMGESLVQCGSAVAGQ